MPSNIKLAEARELKEAFAKQKPSIGMRINNPDGTFHEHRSKIQDDGSQDCIFRWHWPRGTFDRRMSALEIAAFVMPHMPHILPLLSGHPLVYAHFRALLERFVLWPKQVLDEVVPWVKRVEIKDDGNELLVLNLSAKEVPSPGPICFDMGAG